MGGLFSVDGKFAQFMGKLADIIILNVLLVVCSIPIVTAGAPERVGVWLQRLLDHQQFEH